MPSEERIVGPIPDERRERVPMVIEAAGSRRREAVGILMINPSCTAGWFRRARFAQ